MNKSILVILAFIATAGAVIDFKPCIVGMTNGCSVPLGVPFPYKDLYLPACERHDICYQCGKEYNWSRAECDRSFKTNMLSLCKLKEDSKAMSQYTYSLFEKIKSIFHIASQLAKWIGIKAGTIENCVHGTKVYHSAVRRFGQGNYAKGDKKMCNIACASVLGDPKNFIKA